jgi:hypothetical protein
VLAGANNGLLQAEAAQYMGGLSKADHAAALADARAFRETHPAGSRGAMAAFDKLSEIEQFAVRILASIAGGAWRGAATHKRTIATHATLGRTHTCALATSQMPMIAAPQLPRVAASSLSHNAVGQCR